MGRPRHQLDQPTHVTYQSCTDTCSVAYRTSADFGRTWSTRRVISAQPVSEPTMPQPGTTASVESLDPPVSTISRSGRLAVAWQTNQLSRGRYNEVAVSVSNDSGRHWTRPRRANTPTGGPAIVPAVAFTRGGTLGVTYYDARRDNRADAPFSVDLWGTTSADGIHFRPSKHLAGSFDVFGAPGGAQELYLGQSTGLAAVKHHFIAVYLATTCTAGPCPAANPSDVYSSRLPVHVHPHR
jgi:hypothetical protein